jgi:hypothetical protein
VEKGELGCCGGRDNCPSTVSVRELLLPRLVGALMDRDLTLHSPLSILLEGGEIFGVSVCMDLVYIYIHQIHLRFGFGVLKEVLELIQLTFFFFFFFLKN